MIHDTIVIQLMGIFILSQNSLLSTRLVRVVEGLHVLYDKHIHILKYSIIRLVRVVEGLRAGESREGHTQRILAIMR